jgi:hypothetical protein
MWAALSSVMIGLLCFLGIGNSLVAETAALGPVPEKAYADLATGGYAF